MARMYWNKIIVTLLALLFLTGSGSAQIDTNICSMDNPLPGSVSGGPDKPNLPDQFQTRIELTIINKNQTTELVEYFDSVNNRGTIGQTDFDTNLRAIYDYDDDEFIMDFPDDKMCQVSSLDDNEQRFLLGYKTVGGKGRIFSAAQALHWADATIQEQYAGRTTIRGIQVDHWQSCQYWRSEQASMIVHWYFTASTGWDTASYAGPIPVRCWVKGRVESSDEAPHNFEHYYEFFQFRSSIEDGESVFEAPTNYPCPGRINTKPLPTPAKAFSFMSETVSYALYQISYMKEEFDLSTNLVRYTYRPPASDQVVEIHDFNTGVAYIFDPLIGNCTYEPIEKSGFDVHTKNQNQVRIRTANEFFYFDNTIYTYIGKHQARQIDCDAWIATRTDWPPGDGVNSTWTWYFASYAMTIEYNIYNFDEEQPNIFDFDISSCYEFKDRVYFTFKLPGIYNDVILNDQFTFKYSLLLSIIGTAAVSPLRVAHLNFVTSDTDLTVEFELLDKAPIAGDIQNPIEEIPLDVAVAAITATIQAGQFVVAIGGGDDTVYLVGHKDSIQTVTYTAGKTQPMPQVTRYSPGAMAAIGITMPIIGGVIGAVAAYFFFK